MGPFLAIEILILPKMSNTRDITEDYKSKGLLKQREKDSSNPPIVDVFLRKFITLLCISVFIISHEII